METWRVRIRGTIEDVIEVDVEEGTDEEDVKEAALNAWQYVEFQDLDGEVEGRVE